MGAMAEIDALVTQDVVAELRMAQERYAYAAEEGAVHPSEDVRMQADVYALKARRFGQMADKAEREFATADALETRWTARAEEHRGRYLRAKVALSGPALNVMARLIVERLADAARGTGDEDLVGAWDAYTTARINLDAVEEFGGDEVDLSYLVGEEADALRRLLIGLPKSIWLPLPDAQVVAGLLDEHAGRIGTVAP